MNMAERKRLVAGNWKMNGGRADCLALARGVAERGRGAGNCDLLVCPPFTLLGAVGEALAGSVIVEQPIAGERSRKHWPSSTSRSSKFRPLASAWTSSRCSGER